MSGIWTHVDNRLDRAVSSGSHRTIGSNQYNRHGSTCVADPSSSSSSGSTSFSLTSFIPPAIHPPASDMRTFSVRGLFGASLTTNIPGKFSISFPSITRGFRARSEPLPPKDEDVVMASPERLPRSQSEYMITIPQSHTRDTPDNVEAVQEEVADPVRQPSPALTDIEHPDSQDLIVKLTATGIPFRDYANAAPYAADTAKFSNFHAQQGRPPKPVTEIFDQYMALTEIDYRWTQPKRIYPVQGKTLRRLLDMGWLSEAELRTRGSAMDLEELEKFDSRPHYPWRPFRGPSSKAQAPSLEERRDMLKARTPTWVQVDRKKQEMDREMKSLLDEERRVAISQASYEEIMQRRGKGKGREASPSSGTKRRFDEDDAEDEMNATKDHDLDATSENGSVPKKRRITPERETTSSQALLPPDSDAYRKQIMPSVSSQPLTMVPERSDTPPLENESQRQSPSRGTKLVHPKQQRAMKRGLSRTQTFAQL